MVVCFLFVEKFMWRRFFTGFFRRRGFRFFFYWINISGFSGDRGEGSFR